MSMPNAHALPVGHTVRGVMLMLCALVCFAGLDTVAKLLTAQLSPVMVTWARYTSALIFMLILFNPLRDPSVLHSNRPVLQILRSCLLFGSTILNFIALRYLQLDQTTAIQFLAPLLVTLLAGPLLGETIGWRRWVAAGFGFCGVLIITNPLGAEVHWAMLLTLAGTTCYALYAIMTRYLASYDSSDTTSLYSVAIGAIVSLPAVPQVWTPPANAWVVAGLLATGMLGGFGHWLLIRAHSFAPVSTLAPFIYMQLLLALVPSYFVFDHLPAKNTLIGAAVIVASGLYLLTIERQKGGEASKSG